MTQVALGTRLWVVQHVQSCLLMCGSGFSYCGGVPCCNTVLMYRFKWTAKQNPISACSISYSFSQNHVLTLSKHLCVFVLRVLECVVFDCFNVPACLCAYSHDHYSPRNVKHFYLSFSHGSIRVPLFPCRCRRCVKSAQG